MVLRSDVTVTPKPSQNLVAAVAGLIVLVICIYAYPAAKLIRFSSVSTEGLATAAEFEIIDFLKIYETKDVSTPFAYSPDAASWHKYQRSLYEWENSFLTHDGTNGAAVLHRTGLLLPVSAQLTNIHRVDGWNRPAISATLTWSDGRCVEGSAQVPPMKCTEPFRKNQKAAVVIEFQQFGGAWRVWTLAQDPAWIMTEYGESPTFWSIPTVERRENR